MMPTGWVFRVEIVSQKTPYTTTIKEELDELLSESDYVSQYLIEELYEPIKLFEKKETKT